MNRRSFLKFAGLAVQSLAMGFGTTNCNYAPPADTNWAAVPQFSINEFNDWFVAHRLYNGVNKNLKFAHLSQWTTFYSNVFPGFSPGGGGPQKLDSVLSSDSDPNGRIRDEQET